MRDVALRIREQQLIREDGLRLRRLGIEIEHPRLQLGRFPSHHPAQTPKCGTGQLPGPLPFQHLRTLGHEPQTLLGHGVRIGDSLDECECARRRPLRIHRHFCGCRIRPVTVLCDEMHRASQGHIRGQTFDERSPRLAPLDLNRCRDDPRLGRHRACGLRVLADQHHPLILRRELLRKRRRYTAPVGRQDPDTLGQCDLRRALGHDHSAIWQTGCF